MNNLNQSQLQTHLSHIYDSLKENQQYWIGLAGSPGSGKSTLTAELESKMKKFIKILPMDGYHYTIKTLKNMTHAEEALARRGAPFTFDAQRLYKDLLQTKTSGSGFFPSFDHGIGDPIENDIEIQKGKQIIIVEGNYLLLNEPYWSSLKPHIFDETWFLDIPIDVCCERVEKRHIKTGSSLEVAKKRVQMNDRLNAELVRSSSLKNADYLIQF